MGPPALVGPFLATLAATALLFGCSKAGGPPDRPAVSAASAAHRRPRPELVPGPAPAPEGMVWIPGGEFSMGSEDPMMGQDARPVHRVYVDAFWMDETEVTNEQFAAFVKATGYVTVAERTPRAEDFPGAPPENLVAGSVVFTPPAAPVPLDNHFQWWSYVQGRELAPSRGAEERPRGAQK